MLKSSTVPSLVSAFRQTLLQSLLNLVVDYYLFNCIFIRKLCKIITMSVKALLLYSHNVYSAIRLAFISFILLMSFRTQVIAQSWQWVRGAKEASAYATTTDVSGNIYVTGSFGGATTIFGTSTLNNLGLADVFLVKYDSLGNVLWARSAGGAGNDIATSAITDASGNVYITGYFDSASTTITFGSITLTNEASSALSGNMFLVKYNAGGDVVWAKSAGGLGSDEANSMATDAQGNIYIVGNFSSSFTLDTITLSAASGNSDIFIAKYDSSGRIVWAKKTTESYINNATSVCTDVAGNIYLAGYFNGSVIWGTDTVFGGGVGKTLLVKYDSSGNIIWARSSNGSVFDCANSAITDAAGNVYIAGYFNGPGLTFDTSSIFATSATGMNGLLYLVKYDSSGNVKWATGPVSSTAFGIASSIKNDALGDIYFSGAFTGPTIIFGTHTLVSEGPDPTIFLAKYNSLGNVVWAHSIVGNGADYATSLNIDHKGNLYMTGYFIDGALTFDTTTLSCSSGDSAMYLVKLDSANTTSTQFVHPNVIYALNTFPNPANGPFAIHVSTSITEEAQIIITNVIGEKVKELTATTNTDIPVQLDTPPGIYFISAITTQGTQTSKMVVW